MNFQFYLEKLYASEDFQKFIEENKDAYLCSCFFVIDKEKNEDKQHFDYFIPSTNKMFSFKIESGCERVPVENIENKIPKKISDNHNFDFSEIEKIILEKIDKEEIKTKIQKILFSLQNSEGTPQAYTQEVRESLRDLDKSSQKISTKGKDVLLGTVFISALGMIKIQIDLEDMKIIEFEKKSFLDMFKIIKKN
jgi:hypothetical protein